MDSENYIPRSVEEYAFDGELTGRHMVFLAGPRQAGKTMLARKWLEKKKSSPLYFNWDDHSTRRAYLADSRFFEFPARSLGISDPWIVFDEIHKRSRWRDILKGAHDLFGKEFRFLITGSARLDLFLRSGDSLVGRYNLFHMMPLNLREIARRRPSRCFLEERQPARLSDAFEREISDPPGSATVEAFEGLWLNGPFPEPFLKQNERFSRKWHQDYLSLVIREDLKDISRVVEIDKVENLLFLLPDRVAAPLSMANLAHDLEVAHTTVKNWLDQLKKLYLLFPVAPWTEKISRGLKKENKWYFLDWYYVPDEPARLENMAASFLYRACQAMTDKGMGEFRLHYIRTLDKKEIDFLVTADRRPVLAVEVKAGETGLSGTMRTRGKWFPRTPTLGVQVVNRRGVLQKHSDNT